MSKPARISKEQIRSALVTGATGYIGSHLVRRLVRDGWQVAILVRPSSDARAVLAEDFGNVKVVIDHDPDAPLQRQVARIRPDCVFHLAARSGAATGQRQLMQLVRSNVLFGLRVLEAAMACGVPRMVNTGSFWQYDQEGNIRPNGLYAATKQAFEDVFNYYVGNGQIRGTTLELFDVYGPEDPRGKLFSQLIDAMKSGRPLSMSPGKQRVDLVHIDDVVRAYLRAAELLECDRPCGLRYSVSSGRLVELRTVVRRFEALMGRKVPVRWGARPYRPREVMEPHRGTPLPGWKPKISLEEGIRRLD